MIKLNLLPAQFLEQEKVRKFAAIFGIAVAVVIVGMLLWYKTLSAAHADLQVRLQEVQAKERIVKGYQAEAQAARQENQGIMTKVMFIKDLMEYNTQVPKLYEELARYTYKNILYTKVDLTPTELKIEAYARSIGDAGKYLLNMYKATDLFNNVSISAVPGYPDAIATQIPGASEFAGYQGLPSAPNLPYAPMTSPLGEALATAETQQNIEQTPFGFTLTRPRKKGISRPPAGFAFTVTCALKKPINPPVYGQQAVAPGMVGAPGMPPTPGVATPPMSMPEGQGGMGGPAEGM